THAPTPALHTLSLHDALPISATTRAAPSDRSARVNPPGPGPTSYTVAPAMPASRAMRRVRLRSRMKFCPRLLRAMSPCAAIISRSEEHTSELQSRFDLVCRLL